MQTACSIASHVPTDIEVRLLLPCERGVREVLCCGRRSDGSVDTNAVLSFQLLVRSTNAVSKRLGKL